MSADVNDHEWRYLTVLTFRISALTFFDKKVEVTKFTASCNVQQGLEGIIIISFISLCLKDIDVSD